MTKWNGECPGEEESEHSKNSKRVSFRELFETLEPAAVPVGSEGRIFIPVRNRHGRYHCDPCRFIYVSCFICSTAAEPISFWEGGGHESAVAPKPAG